MTHRDAMLLLIDKTDRVTEAVKILRSIDSNSPMANSRAEKLIRVAIDEASRLTEHDKVELSALISVEQQELESRTETIRFRVTPNEKNIIKLLAVKYAGGNMSKLIISTLNEKYPTL